MSTGRFDWASRSRDLGSPCTSNGLYVPRPIRFGVTPVGGSAELVIAVPTQSIARQTSCNFLSIRTASSHHPRGVGYLLLTGGTKAFCDGLSYDGVICAL